MRSIIAGSLFLLLAACGSNGPSGAGGGSAGAGGGGTAGGSGGGVGGGGSAGGGGGGSSSSDGGSYLRANINGTPTEWNGTQVTVLGSGIIFDPFGIMASQLTPQLRQLSFLLVYRDAGTGRNFVCDSMTFNTLTFNDGGYWRAGSDGGCSVQFTNLASASGDYYTGTFSGVLRGLPGYDAGDVTVTAGEFRARQP